MISYLSNKKKNNNENGEKHKIWVAKRKDIQGSNIKADWIKQMSKKKLKIPRKFQKVFCIKI